MNTLGQDLRYAVRMLRQAPGLAAIAILTLALGIGANTALSSVVNGVLLNPLAYPQSRQLVAIYGKTTGVEHTPVSYLNFLDWQRLEDIFLDGHLSQSGLHAYGHWRRGALARVHDFGGFSHEYIPI